MPPRAATGRPPVSDVLPSPHIVTVGVRRPGYGSGGKASTIQVNSFVTTIPDGIIHHYDVAHYMLLVVISPTEKTLPVRVNMDLIHALQHDTDPVTFSPPGVYDGRKNFFSVSKLSFGDSREFDVTLPLQEGEKASNKGPKVFKIRLTHVATINTEILNRFVAGKQSHDNAVLTAITALNVVIRMAPTMIYPFNVRSFFTSRERKDIGGGLELWRGYFQSVRPAIGRMLINIDISTGTMYKAGPLLDICLEYIKKPDATYLSPRRGFPDRERLRLQRFISGIRIYTPNPEGRKIARVIKKLSSHGSSDLTFSLRDGGTMTVAQYFKQTQNKPLRFPDVICVEVGQGALIPLELCMVPAGQIMRKQVPPEKTKSVLDFATKKPEDRLTSIKNGLEVLAYGQSEYVRQFGMNVDTTGPLSVQARILKPPVLKYGPGSKQRTIQPSNGAWNMREKRFFQPAVIKNWVLVVYESEKRFGKQVAQDVIDGIIAGCRSVGIQIQPTKVIAWKNGQGDIGAGLKEAGKACVDMYGVGPNLMVIILPEGGNDIYTAVKHFGDVTMGVATQCLKSSKCYKAKAQYFANVCLKINVKLGGINLIPDPASVAALTDPHNPTIVMGADVIHPAPGSDGRPSFTALVANVDSDTAKYVAECGVQTSRQEMIEHLQSMAKNILDKYMGYRTKMEKKGPNTAPKRIIFYRDGVSEGQFQQVLDQELSALKAACQELGINPKITIIVVGKRHHVRFFPQPNSADKDSTGNCPAGTVVDREIGHPSEFDFYLQSHGGLLGTSRPAHYSILYDENSFSADALQSLSFALCHVYARSTRSVSIPAPVYYADIVCSRAKNHYDPQAGLDLSDSATNLDSAQAETSLDAFRRGFKPLNQVQKFLMYFSVRRLLVFAMKNLR
ncbi:argonaute-like protein [Dendrothele bispora CBS 962.96]|uniref:Argonaute-like protein n=1 Tax=Dendrothele bispora (strain CBS 962.96) TaxID=1314807 RepID=A0A4S8N0A6_DENBC|nr:argonaute-like protein [Dendrothele bispora CBS 962.96]